MDALQQGGIHIAQASVFTSDTVPPVFLPLVLPQPSDQSAIWISSCNQAGRLSESLFCNSLEVLACRWLLSVLANFLASGDSLFGSISGSSVHLVVVQDRTKGFQCFCGHSYLKNGLSEVGLGTFAVGLRSVGIEAFDEGFLIMSSQLTGGREMKEE